MRMCEAAAVRQWVRVAVRRCGVAVVRRYGGEQAYPRAAVGASAARRADVRRCGDAAVGCCGSAAVQQ